MSGRRTAKFKIEPFRHPLALDSNYAANTWKVLEDAIHEIHNQNASGLSFEELYRNAYMMVLQKHGDRVYDGLTNVLKQHLQGIAAQVEQHNGVVFLKVIEEKWADYQKSTQMIRDILMYMDRTYVRNQNKTPVFQLGMQLWRDHVVHHPVIRQRLLSVMLEMVQKERGGEVIDRPLMRALTKMLMALGQGVYVSDWEQPFLQTSAEFYQKEAQAFLADSNCPKYLQKAQKRLAEEKERVEHYMEASVTEHNITRVVDRELISKQMHTLTDMEKSGLVALLEADQYADLERMYLLFRRVDTGLDIIREKMGNHVKATGLVLVQDPENTKSAVDFVKVLLQLRSKYADVIAKGFDNDRLFQQSLNLAFESFINKNMRAPEFISLFIDDTLRKANKDLQDTEVEGVLDEVMVLFRYLQEKDMFEKYYKQHLGKRLLNGRVVCDYAERSLLVKLKGECGYQFTSKLESMFNDIRTSRETLQQFKQHASKHRLALPIELSVQVLTTGSWPMQHSSKCNLPVAMEQASQVFGDFYLETHSGRRLAWQTNLGTVDVKCCFGEGRSRRHELNVSTYQACVLMLFNDTQQLTFRDIAAATDIPRSDLKRALQSMSLIKGRNVLRKEPAGKEVEEEDVFSVNDNFTSKLFKVKIGTVSASKDGEHEKAEVRSMVEEDRKPQIEAAIVRIMKARRLLDHNSIISEVTRQLQSRFLPSPAVIKKRIESLIEREFLERDPQDRKSYRYLA